MLHRVLAELRVDLSEATAKLSDVDRYMIGMWLAGYSQVEIAAHLGVRQGTVSKGIKASFCQLGQILAYQE
jgi:IS30 family transposase